MRSRLSPLAGPFRFRDFRLMWGAEVFSQLGDWAGRLALSVLVAERTGSTFLTALVTTVSVLPYIGIGQWLAAHSNRRPRLVTIVVADLGRALIFGLLVIDMPIWLILVLAFTAGCMTVPFEAARNTLTPHIVPREIYGDAVAVVSITFDMSVMLGYAVGGALIAAIGVRPALLINAASFLVSLGLLYMIPATRRNLSDTAEVRVRDGWRALVDDRYVRRFLTGYTAVGACAVVGEALVALYAIEVLDREAGVSGLLAAAIPIGAILATVFARAHGSDTSKLRRASVVATIGSILGIAVFVAAPSLPLILLGFAAIGVLNASRVPANEVAVLRLEDRVRVPAFAVLNGFFLGSQALAAAVGGLIARGIGVRETIVLSLLISAGFGIWGALSPPRDLRHARQARTTSSP